MFTPNLATKELIDALMLCRDALKKLPKQPIPSFDAFVNTSAMENYLDHLIRSVEGRASGEGADRQTRSERGAIAGDQNISSLRTYN